MASNNVTMNVTAVFKNRKAIRALRVVAQFIAEEADGSWKPEAKRAAKAMRYALKHLTCKVEKE